MYPSNAEEYRTHSAPPGRAAWRARCWVSASMKPALRFCTFLALAPFALACETRALDDDDSSSSSDTEEHAIKVSAQGEAWSAPDVLDVDVGVSVLRPTVAQAVADATREANAVIDAVVAKGVAREDVQTASYTISPEYRYGKDNERSLEGYRVANTLRVRIRRIETAGTILDAVAAAGGDDTVVSGLSFTVDDPTPVLKKAREDAWNDAYAKARELAALADVGLGPPINIDEGVSMPAPMPMMAAADVAEGVRVTPIEPGQSKVVVNLNVSFEIVRDLPAAGR